MFLSYSPHHLGVLASKNSYVNNDPVAFPRFINVRILEEE